MDCSELNTEIKARLLANRLALSYVLGALAAEDRLALGPLYEKLAGLMAEIGSIKADGATPFDPDAIERLRKTEAFGVDELDDLFGNARTIEGQFRRERPLPE